MHRLIVIGLAVSVVVLVGSITAAFGILIYNSYSSGQWTKVFIGVIAVSFVYVVLFVALLISSSRSGDSRRW